MRFRLRTLLIILAIGPPLLSGAWLVWRHHTAIARKARIEQLEAEIAKIVASQKARALKLQQLKQKSHEIVFQMILSENKLHKVLPTDQMQAETGVYFLGPELLTSTEIY
jgi:hypothetical protein